MITRADVVELAKQPADPAVSLFMPVVGRSEDRRMNSIRFRNLLGQAEKTLNDRGYDAAAALASVPGEDEWPLWADGDGGFACFVGNGTARCYDLPIPVDEEARVGEAFHIRPLIAAVNRGAGYFLLCLDQRHSRLMRGNRYGIAPWRDEVMRESFARIAGRSEVEANVDFHPASGSTTGGEAPAQRFHAQGDSPPDYKQVELDEFVRGVAKAVDEVLHGHDEPLVVAAEPNLLGMYRRHAHYPALMDIAVSKAPSGLSEDELFAESLDVVRGEIDRGRRDTAERVIAALSRGDSAASSDPPEIAEAAAAGRVAALLIADHHAPPLGDDGDEGEPATPTPEGGVRAAQDDPLLAQVITFGGAVHALQPHDLPDGIRLAALFHY